MSDQVVPATHDSPGPPARRRLGPDHRAAAAWLRSGDVALAYAAIVVAVAVLMSFESPATHTRVVLQLSTNLVNLHHRPVGVLIDSAFVVNGLGGLVEVPLLVVAYTVAQRWVGRAATIFVGVLGHVGATLFVATLLASGITTGRLSHSVARVSDVGVSYGLACVAAFVVSRVPKRWRPWYVAALVIYYAGPLAWNPNFTSVGHSTALTLGFGVAFVAHRASTVAISAGDDPATG